MELAQSCRGCIGRFGFIVAGIRRCAQAPSRPNIVFILMDNLGYGEVGVYGGGITGGAPTPRIDRLAAEGTRLGRAG
jgi:Sulfatase